MRGVVERWCSGMKRGTVGERANLIDNPLRGEKRPFNTPPRPELVRRCPSCLLALPLPSSSAELPSRVMPSSQLPSELLRVRSGPTTSSSLSIPLTPRTERGTTPSSTPPPPLSPCSRRLRRLSSPPPPTRLTVRTRASTTPTLCPVTPRPDLLLCDGDDIGAGTDARSARSAPRRECPKLVRLPSPLCPFLALPNWRGGDRRREEDSRRDGERERCMC